MNSCIQCLSHTFELSTVFRRITESDLNRTSVVGSKGLLATEFANAIRKVWSMQPGAVYNPSTLKKQIGKLNETFAGFAQQDSQELLRFLLDGLHEDLNRVRQKPKWYELEDVDGETDATKAARYWQYNVERNSSPVGDLFAGQLMSELVCSRCSRRSTCFDPCWDVSVQLDARSSSCRLETCLDAFAAPETLTGDDGIYCSRCKKLTPQQKTLRFSRLPRYLVVHIKRFEQHRKLPTNVRFPMCEERLEMGKYLVGGNGRESHSYRLYGVCNHMGSLNGGHYTAFARNAGDNQWYQYNDERVTRINGPDVAGPEAYVLYYERMDVDGQPY